jgi:hypothetical protein
MSDKESITFRCDADILEVLDYLGRERYQLQPFQLSKFREFTRYEILPNESERTS